MITWYNILYQYGHLLKKFGACRLIAVFVERPARPHIRAAHNLICAAHPHRARLHACAARTLSCAARGLTPVSRTASHPHSAYAAAEQGLLPPLLIKSLHRRKYHLLLLGAERIQLVQHAYILLRKGRLFVREKKKLPNGDPEGVAQLVYGEYFGAAFPREDRFKRRFGDIRKVCQFRDAVPSLIAQRVYAVYNIVSDFNIVQHMY